MKTPLLSKSGHFRLTPTTVALKGWAPIEFHAECRGTGLFDSGVLLADGTYTCIC
jgi:hypothetical protein